MPPLTVPFLTLAAGLDHLLVDGRGAGGSLGAESKELHVACFMGLVSYLASRPQALRVAPYYRTKLLNAVAKAISQSATITETPFTDAGLYGSGEVIQVKILASLMVNSSRARKTKSVALKTASTVAGIANLI